MENSLSSADIINEINTLPSLPSTTMKIIKLVEDPNSKPTDIANVIALDPSITAKVLRLVNSAFYGLRKEVTTVAQAVVYLGYNIIKNLALTVAVFDTMKLGDEHQDLFAQLLLHSIATGFAAELISKELELHDESENFTFGILHDIGKIIQMEYFTEQFLKAYKDAEENKMLFIEAEKRYFELDHNALSSLLFTKWMLPENLCQSIKGHYNFNSVDLQYKRSAAIIYLADHITQKADIGSNFNFSEQELDKTVFNLLVIDRNIVPKLVKTLKAMQPEIKDFVRGMQD